MAGARKKRTIIEEQIPEGQEEQEGLSAFDVALESVEDLEALTDVMEQFGQTGQLLKLYRDNGQYCYQSDAIDEAFIQKHFGGGDYRIRVFFNGKYKKTFPVAIAAAMNTGEPNGNGNHSGDRHSEFLEKLLLTMISSNGASKGPSITELTTALANLDGLRGKQESGMDLFQRGVTFAKEIMDMKSPGNGDWKSELVSAAKDALPIVGGILASKSGVSSMPTPKNPNELVTASQEQQIEAIRQGLAYLKKQCLKGVNPELIVEWVENNAEDYQPLIHNVLNLPFEKFVEIDAEIGNEPFKQWFTGLFNGLRSAFVPDNTVGMDSPGEHGDIDDAGNHGDTGTNPKRKGK